MRYSNFKVREQCFFSLLQNSKKISEIRDQNIPILSEKCYNSSLQHDTCLYYVANERSVCRLSNGFQKFKVMYYHIREHLKITKQSCVRQLHHMSSMTKWNILT